MWVLKFLFTYNRKAHKKFCVEILIPIGFIKIKYNSLIWLKALWILLYIKVCNVLNM